MYNIILSISLCFMLFSTVVNADPESHRSIHSASLAQFSYKGDVVTAKFRDVPLRQALQLIFDNTGIAFHVDKGVDGRVNHDFHGISLDKAMYRFLRSYNYAIIFDDKTGRVRMQTVWIFQKGAEGRLAAQYDRIEQSITPGNSVSIAKQAINSASAVDEKPVAVSSSRARLAARVRHGPGTAAGYGRLMQVLRETQQSISLLQHKMGAEDQIIQQQQRALQGQLALANDGSKPGLIKEIHNLEGKAIRAKQNNVQMLLNEKKNQQELMALQSVYQPPATQKQQWLARQNRQRAVSRPQQRGWR